tara:strand:- start:4906 stop:5106 length:201 start_codon:yes stop_codon:yes gene_type:complete
VIGLLTRLALRYLAGALIAIGWSESDAMWFLGDPEIVSYITLGIGALIGTGTELWYALAKRWGWRT